MANLASYLTGGCTQMEPGNFPVELCTPEMLVLIAATDIQFPI